MLLVTTSPLFPICVLCKFAHDNESCNEAKHARLAAGNKSCAMVYAELQTLAGGLLHTKDNMSSVVGAGRKSAGHIEC